VLSRWQSNDCLNFSSMIYAYGQDDIALTGDDWTSIFDGQGGVPFDAGGDCWWTWKGKNRTIDAVAQGTTPNYNKNKASQRTPNPLNPTSLAALAPQLDEAQRLLIQVRAKVKVKAGAPTRRSCRRCPKPGCRWRAACSASATSCARR
jgi:polygalacturonase